MSISPFTSNVYSLSNSQQSIESTSPSLELSPYGFRKLLADPPFPPGLIIITGDLDLSDTELTSLPKRLHAKGNLYLSYISSTSLPEALCVDGDLDLCGASVTSLPKELHVGGDLDLRKTQITSLPKGLHVGGDLDLRETQITSLPEGLHVGGNLDLSETQVTSLPEGLHVGGSLRLSCTSLPNGLYVGRDLYLSDSPLTSLPNKLYVGGTLDLTRTQLTSVPAGLHVGKRLSLRETPLTSLPEGFRVEGDLDLHGTQVTSLPEGLHVGGSLDLRGTEVISLPEGLHVGKRLHLSNTHLTSLPKGLHVGGGLNLCKSGVTSLPEGFHVGCSLDLSETPLTSLPVELHVGGDLDLRKTRVTSLPEGLHVSGDLELSETRVTSLPEGFRVGRGLYLSNTRLTSLPNRLHVGGNLDLRETPLTSLPEDLHVGGNLNLSGCDHLSSLPSWITTLGRRADRGIREVNLENTGLSERMLRQLRQTSPEGMRFYFSHRASKPKDQFRTLEKALAFWKKAAKSDQPLTNLNLDGLEHLNTTTFLSRLTATAEYKNPNTRSALAQRVMNVLHLMATDEEYKQTALLYIADALSSCDDRVILSLDQIEIAYRIQKAKDSEEELLKLGKGLYFLEQVDKKANEHAGKLTWVDEIEIHLAFRIGLTEKLGLPLSTQNMIFRGCAQITDEEIDAIGKTILDEDTQEAFDKFLESWEPWQKYQSRSAKMLSYEKLPIAEGKRLEEDEVCLISQDKPEQPILYNGHVYDYEWFCGCYKENDKDPMPPHEKIDLAHVRRIVN